MNDIQLECFVTVSETLNFMKASEELHLSQSTVSKQIRSLEEELNVKLFNRSTRKVELTAVGESFLPEAAGILSDMHHARSRIASFRYSSAYSVRIGYTEVTELPMMSEAFRQMRREYPNVVPYLRVGSAGDNLSRLEQGGLDGAMGLNDVEYHEESIAFYELMKVDLRAVIAKGHPLYERESITSGELKRYAQILYIPEHRREYYMGAPQDQEHAVFIVSSAAEAYALAAAGMGYAVLPSCYAVTDDEIRAVRIEDAEKKSYGCYMHKGMEFPALRRYVEFMRSAAGMKGKS